MTAEWWALACAVIAAMCLGLVWRARQGRIRVRNTAAGAGVEPTVFDQLPQEISRTLRERVPAGSEGSQAVTLLQLSTTFCAPCRHTRILLTGLAERTEGIRHVEVDLTHHPDWSTPLGVHTTPTTLALDDAGRELFRFGGVPRRDRLTEVLRPYLD